MKKRLQRRCFRRICKIFKIFKNTFFYKTTTVAASAEAFVTEKEFR